MKTYIFEMTHWIDLVTAQTFEAVACWDHCQMFYQPVYCVRVIAISDQPCPWCRLQNEAGAAGRVFGGINPRRLPGAGDEN